MTTRSAYGPKARTHGITFPDKTPTKQSFKNECDINHIMAKYQKTGVITHVNNHAAQYGYVPAINYQEALALVKESADVFDELPSKIRQRFKNDPAEFLKFCEDPDNRSEMALLGLLKPEEPSTESPSAQPSDSASAPRAPNPADIEPTHESA